MSHIDGLPERIREHLRSITASSGLPDTEESLELIAENWVAKHRLFLDQTALLSMEQADRFEADDPRGLLILTYSGSLISLGTLGESGRSLEYASIKLRADVPKSVREAQVALADAVTRDTPVALGGSSIEKTSNVLEIVVCPADLSLAEQEQRLREATIFLTNGFAKMNRSVTLPGEAPEHFTLRSMVKYVAQRHDLSQTAVREIIDDYFSVAEAGMLMEERVPLGRLGRVFLGKRGPQKARVGRNPATGEELLIPAKPPRWAPRISFSSQITDRAAALPIDESDAGEAWDADPAEDRD
ncbi:MAG: HU family DNA-binding protein [Spirochaetota bacterium]